MESLDQLPDYFEPTSRLYIFPSRSVIQHLVFYKTHRRAIARLESLRSCPKMHAELQLWATKGKGIPHNDIVAAMGVTRATVSGLMAALEREGFVKSSVDQADRRKLIARLTPRGDAVTRKAFEANLARFRAVFASFSSAELTSLMAFLDRLREGPAGLEPATKRLDH
jgi:DNA-binding MarR family transcriptional regulator